MKILYASGNRKGAQIQLLRFLSFGKQNLHVKVAGFAKHCPGLYLDWNLEALQNMFSVETISFDNDNLRTYYNQVKYYNPDLIISDLELYTSYIGIELGIPVWQVSPSLLYYGLTQQDKISLNVYRHYSYFFNRQNIQDDILQNILINSDKKLVYSHFGDVGKTKLNEGYNWVRPYHILGKISIPCEHNICAATIQNEKKFLNYLKSFKDVVLFSSNLDEEYNNVQIKDFLNLKEYGCNITNCNVGANQGNTDFLADLYYANKYSLVMIDFTQSEYIVNGLLSEYLNLGKIVYTSSDFNNLIIESKIDSNINYLHEEIGKL